MLPTSARLAVLVFLLGLIGALVVAVPGPALASDDFSDVGDDHSFHDEISWLADQGITQGYSDGTFRPTTAVTRQATAAFLHRLSGAFPGPFLDPDFSDVDQDHGFYTEIAWMAEGISQGYADDTFRPATDVTRQATAAFLYRLAGSPPGPFDDPGFSDVDQDHSFYTEIAWMAEEGITQGYADDTFRPATDVTRQATAAFLYRLATGTLATVSGTVADVSDAQDGAVSDGQPLQDAWVRGFVGDGITRAAATDAGGQYLLRVPAGTHDLQATADGFAQAYGWYQEDVQATAGSDTPNTDFGLYPKSDEPGGFRNTTSTAEDVSETSDWWIVTAEGGSDTRLDVDESTEIVYVNPNGVVVGLGDADTDADSWWSKTGDEYAEGVHTLYYNTGSGQNPTWWRLQVEFDGAGDLVAVNGDPYVVPTGMAATANSADTQPSLVVPSS